MSGRLACRLDGAAEAAWNMAADELLAEGVGDGLVRMRFYSWREPTVSIGAFQPHAAFAAAGLPPGLAFVRRPSGGGAILHGTDLTYAIAVGRSHPWAASAERLYEGVHAVVVETLRAAGLPAAMVPPQPAPPRGPGLAPRRPDREEAFLCFDRRSRGDVVVGDHKVLGSGQRRHRLAVVQHGSLLLRSWSCGEGAGAVSRQPGIGELLGREVDPDDFAVAWAGRLAETLGIPPPEVEPPLGKRDMEAVEAVAGRYRSEAWSRRR